MSGDLVFNRNLWFSIHQNLSFKCSWEEIQLSSHYWSAITPNSLKVQLAYRQDSNRRCGLKRLHQHSQAMYLNLCIYHQETEEDYVSFSREGCFYSPLDLPICWKWIHTSQREYIWCSMPLVWMATTPPLVSSCVWGTVTVKHSLNCAHEDISHNEVNTVKLRQGSLP